MESVGLRPGGESKEDRENSRGGRHRGGKIAGIGLVTRRKGVTTVRKETDARERRWWREKVEGSGVA